jgi:hypothetical protein
MNLESEPRARAEIAVTLSRALGMIGDHGRAVAVLARAADEFADRDEDFALRVQAEWITVARLHRATRPKARERCAALRAHARPPRPATSLLLANLALDALEDGEPAQMVAELATDALTGGWLLEEESFGFSYAANALIWIDEYELADRAWAAARAAAQRRGSAALFALVSGWRCQLAYRRGALQEAEAEGQISVRLVAEHEWDALRGYPHAKLSDAVMERGDYPAAQALLVGDADAEQIPFFLDSRGRLRCLLGRFADGLEDFLRCGEALDARGGRDSPGIIPWRSHAAIAYSRLDAPERARALAAEELKLAQACGAPRAIGIALRALGLAEEGERGIERLQAAVRILERSQARLELARALIDLGAALRRSRRRERARDPLRRGLDLAHRCGAHSLADRAHAELLATGARPRRAVLSGLESLTPSERRVAELAGEGLSNRQIAQVALYLDENGGRAPDAHVPKAGNPWTSRAVRNRPRHRGRRVSREAAVRIRPRNPPPHAHALPRQLRAMHAGQRGNSEPRARLRRGEARQQSRVASKRAPRLGRAATMTDHNACPRAMVTEAGVGGSWLTRLGTCRFRPSGTRPRERRPPRRWAWRGGRRALVDRMVRSRLRRATCVVSARMVPAPGTAET